VECFKFNGETCDAAALFKDYRKALDCFKFLFAMMMLKDALNGNHELICFFIIILASGMNSKKLGNFKVGKLQDFEFFAQQALSLQSNPLSKESYHVCEEECMRMTETDIAEKPRE